MRMTGTATDTDFKKWLVLYSDHKVVATSNEPKYYMRINYFNIRDLREPCDYIENTKTTNMGKLQ